MGRTRCWSFSYFLYLQLEWKYRTDALFKLQPQVSTWMTWPALGRWSWPGRWWWWTRDPLTSSGLWRRHSRTAASSTPRLKGLQQRNINFDWRSSRLSLAALEAAAAASGISWRQNLSLETRAIFRSWASTWEEHQPIHRSLLTRWLPPSVPSFPRSLLCPRLTGGWQQTRGLNFTGKVTWGFEWREATRVDCSFNSPRSRTVFPLALLSGEGWFD